jgi:ribosomal protein S18 acetylase RimI-like enzyme
MAAFESNAEAHFPSEPVWYLQALGIAPEAQGQGIGSKLIQPMLDLTDARQETCYLETGTDRNVRFYERFGFEVREAGVQLAPHGPTHWTMIRRPQSSSS